MKVLIIEDDQTVVIAVQKALRKINAEGISFKPVVDDVKRLITQLEQLCREKSFDLALLDYLLWDGFEGYIFLETLRTAHIPFIAFCHCMEHNSSLMESGAIGFINKNDLYNSSGLDEDQLLRKLKGYVDSLTNKKEVSHAG